MARITTVKTHASGIALGGIGAGSVELLPDGELHFWQIANPPRLTRVCFEDKVDDGESSTGALSFYVREKVDKNAPIVRKLGMKIDDIECNSAYQHSGLSVYSVAISISSQELKKYKTHTQIIDALRTLDYIYHIEEM